MQSPVLVVELHVFRIAACSKSEEQVSLSKLAISLRNNGDLRLYDKLHDGDAIQKNLPIKQFSNDIGTQ